MSDLAHTGDAHIVSLIKTLERRITYWRGRAKAAQRREAELIEQLNSCHRWAEDLAKKERLLGDRCSFLYEKALAHGATREELAGDR